MTANVDVLLARLDQVRKYGDGWRAKCPACGGRSRDKVSIAIGSDGRILLHCFSGCDAAAVVQAAGLELGDLFPERLEADTPEDRRRRQRLARASQWGAALESLRFEAGIVAIAAEHLLRDEPLDWDDFQRLALAQQRIEAAEAVLIDEPRCSREQGARLPKAKAR